MRHLGARPQSASSARGFERSFAFIPGGHNYFGHTYPGERDVAAACRADGKPGAELPTDFYSS